MKVPEKLKLGNKGNRKLHGGWDSAFVVPGGKFWKRQSSKRARKAKFDLSDGMQYKKTFGWFEWS